jgi:hypothetical protein
MKTLGRIAVATASAVTLALAPVGIAAAQSTSSAPRDHREDVSIALNDTQRPRVLAARSDYIAAASTVRTAYRSSVEAILDEARATTAPAGLKYEIAKDAYAFTRATGGDAAAMEAAKSAVESDAAAYKAALQSARTVAQPKLDAAKSTARSALDDAASKYRADVIAAVPDAPQALLVPPGRGKSWISHGFGKDYGMGWSGAGRR